MTLKTNIASAVSIALLSVAGSATAEVTLYDYTEATSEYEDASVTGYFNAADGNPSVKQIENGIERQSSYSAGLTGNYDRVFSSPNRDIDLGALVVGTISKGSNAGENSSSTLDASVSGQVSNYFRPNSKGAFWFGEGKVAGKKGKEDLESSVNVGLGYGRVVDATPMAKVIRLVEALREIGELKAVPSKSAHQKTANIISRKDEYIAKHGPKLYPTHWYADIEKALGQGKLGAGAVLEIYDVLNVEKIIDRRIGWKVQAGVGVALSTFDGNGGGDPSLSFAAEYHKPLNNKTQFSNEAFYVPTFGSSDAYNFGNLMTLSYELSDKVDWENSWNLSHGDSDSSSSSTTNTFSSLFIYELDNQLDLRTDLRFVKDEDLDDVDSSINVSVGYQLR